MNAAYRIEDGLYQGAMRIVVEHWPEIRNAVDVVLILAHSVEFIPEEYEPGIVKIVMPIPDDPNGLDQERWDRLWSICEFVKDKRVLTVCHMGENRSGLASAMILMARGRSPAEAIRLIRASGPARSAGQPYLLWNPGFARQVAECR